MGDYLEDRNVQQMVRDELACNKIESWGEWNFLAKDVPVDKQGYEDLSYDILVVDLENRRIQADTFGYPTRVSDLVSEAVDNLENQYGYLTPSVSVEMAHDDDFYSPRLGDPGEPQVFWSDDEEWMLRTSEFDSVSRELFGYDVLSRGYDRIDAESC
ncbi:MAG: hypothetical protein ABEJ36_05745 [Candidatus Nanosalina sp.]